MPQLHPPDLAALLTTIEHAARFLARGHSAPAPLLELDGFGLLPLPVVPHLLEPLRAASEPAPYGRGPHTLVDPQVRSCHQLAADRVRVPDSFQPVLDGIVADASTQLGVAGKARAHLYKLLIYGPGDFFVPHRDTEKQPGMFATLVVTLPSVVCGGALRVHHGLDDETVAWPANTSGVHWAPFYADCRHEVLPVTEGTRVALVYNLVKVGAPTGPATDDRVVPALAAKLGAWNADDPTKLVYLLDHHYTEA